MQSDPNLENSDTHSRQFNASITMKNLILILGLLTHQVCTIELSAQALNAKVLESSFFIFPNGGGQYFLTHFNLNQDSLFAVLSSKVNKTLNLKSIESTQPVPFLFTKRKNKNLKNLTSIDRRIAEKFPADIYLIFLVTVDPPYPSMLSDHLVRIAVTLEVFVYDRQFQRIQQLKAKKKNTGLMLSTDVDDTELPDYSFFELDRESFLDLFDKALKRLSPKPSP